MVVEAVAVGAVVTVATVAADDDDGDDAVAAVGDDVHAAAAVVAVGDDVAVCPEIWGRSSSACQSLGWRDRRSSCDVVPADDLGYTC